MSRRRDDRKRARRTTDPVGVPGTIVGPGLDDDPYARDSVVVDSSNAVLLDYSSAAVAHLTRNGVPDDALAITLAGKVNQRTERAEVLFLTDVAGAAALVAELAGLCARAGLGEAFTAELDLAMSRMPT